MTTIPDPSPRSPQTTTPPRSLRRRQQRDPWLLAWPIGLLLLLALLAMWRLNAQPATASDAADKAAAAVQANVETSVRRFGELRLEVPRSWGTLSRSRDHVSWGTADRSHTVTVASVEASVLPLPGVVAASVRETQEQLPDTELIERPSVLQIDEQYAPREDSALLARFEASGTSQQPLQVAQVWRRDARGERDLIATWTSTDGTWPISPERGIPRTSASR
ncbi:MAG: hypothetical protein ABI200_04240 [Gaiellales bacterium]